MALGLGDVRVVHVSHRTTGRYRVGGVGPVARRRDFSTDDGPRPIFGAEAVEVVVAVRIGQEDVERLDRVFDPRRITRLGRRVGGVGAVLEHAARVEATSTASKPSASHGLCIVERALTWSECISGLPTQAESRRSWRTQSRPPRRRGGSHCRIPRSRSSRHRMVMA